MAIAFYDADQILFSDTDSLRAYINGYRGGDHQSKIYLRNDDAAQWMTNIVLSLRISTYDGAGDLGTSGFSIKFLYGERQPTEAEWDIVLSGDSLALPNIGTTLAADISTYHPIWIRIYCPGNTSAQINESFTLRLNYLPRPIGA